MRFLLALLLAGAACRPPGSSTGSSAELSAPQVRYRPVFEVPPGDAAMLVDSLPGASWDRGLAAAAQEMASLHTDRQAFMDPASQALVAARAGFPGQVRFARVLNGGAFPSALVEEIALECEHPKVDVGLARRDYGDDTTLWIVAWAPRVLDMDPTPRQLPLDESMALRVDGQQGDELALFHAEPGGLVEQIDITAGVARWLDVFHMPGRHVFEVVVRRDEVPSVALLFSVFVDGPAPEPAPLRVIDPQAADPMAAEAQLYDALDEVRQAHGLPPVERFELFEPLAREHSALMGSTGMVAHVLPDVTPGVAAKAEQGYHPRASHYENVAAALRAEDALALLESSPGHLRNLLCEECTHASIGVALEPVLDRPPRLFVTWELLAFPNGPPREIDHYNR